MKLCWHKDPSLRPTMKQCHQWTSDVKFERLRAQITLGSCSAISSCCVSRIEHQYETEWIINSGSDIDQGGLSTTMNGVLLTQRDVQKFGVDMDIIAPNDNLEIEESFVKVDYEDLNQSLELIDGQQQSLEEPKHQTSSSSLHDTKVLTASLLQNSYTQIWMCGRDQKKGLLSVFIFPDNQKSISVSCFVVNIVYSLIVFRDFLVMLVKKKYNRCVLLEIPFG